MTVSHLEEARTKLGQDNSEAIGLPGREDKILELETFLSERLRIKFSKAEKKARVSQGLVANIRGRHDSKTVFVCGVPGTGKTAVVMNVLDRLRKQSKMRDSTLSSFASVYVNAQFAGTPEKIYTDILWKLTDMKVSSTEKAQLMLERILIPSTGPVARGEPNKKRKCTTIGKLDLNESFIVVVIDELDLLYSERRQSVFYNLFDWPTSNESKLILIAIANAMDLPERFMQGRVSSRLGWNKIIFEPYTGEHLESILKAKLGTTLMNKCFERNAILVATKRIGKTTGDARRIIDTCCLAVDHAIKEKVSKVTSQIVDRVGFQNIERDKADYIENCTPLQLLILKGILNEVRNHGEDNVYALGVYKQVTHALRTSGHEWMIEYVIGHDEFHQLLNLLHGTGVIGMDMNKYVLSRRVCIRDQSEVFRDLIRQKKMEVVA